MNFIAIRTFLMIVETGNLNRAAERLNVTQSTVTARLNALETDIGQPLVHRRKSGAELTSAGFTFHRYAQVMSDLWRQAKAETALPEATVTICNIGCHFDLWADLGQTFLETVRHEHPDVALAAWPGEQTDIDRWLDIGLIDAAFCYAPSLREGTAVTRLGEDRIVLVCSQPDTEALGRDDYIYVDSGEEVRRLYAAAYPGRPSPAVTFGCAVWGREHLLRHGGAAYLPERLVHTELAAGSLHRAGSAEIFSRTAYFVMRRRMEEAWPWLRTTLEAARARL